MNKNFKDLVNLNLSGFSTNEGVTNNEQVMEVPVRAKTKERDDVQCWFSIRIAIMTLTHA